MLNAIVRFSLRFRGIVIALACALLGYGLYSLTQARYDVFPEFAPPQVVVSTDAPGLAPEQVEVLVTQPIENAINGAPGIQSLRSGSIQGLSVITVNFHSKSNIYLDRQVVAERLAVVAGTLPTGVHPPILAPLTSSTSIVMAVGMTSPKLSVMDLTTVADWTVRQRLLAVHGVAKVVVFGAQTEQAQIQFSPAQLVRHDLTVADVTAAARRATAIRGAGFIDTPNQRIVIQSRGQSISPQQIARTVLLRQGGTNLTLGDVANVVDAPAPRVGGAAVMGHPAIILMISSQYGANTLDVTRGLVQALNGLRPALAAEGITIHDDIFRPADFIETALHNVRTSLLIGGILVIVVLFLFLFNFRTAAISCTAIPLSLLAAVIVLEQLGLSLNTITLGGLAIALGEVVDDAVIDVENIHRRLRENRSLPNPRPVFRVVLDASIEVRSAVVYATFAVILVFVPVLTLSGLAGRIFAPLAVAYICALLASLLVALTVTPALAFLLLGNQDLPAKDPPVVGWLKERYAKLLAHVEEWPGVVIVAVALLIVLGVATIPFLKGAFLPELQEGHFIVHMKAVPGTSIQESLRMGRRVTRALMKLPSVSFVAQRVGRAELSDDNAGTFASEFEVGLKIAKRDQNAAARSDIMTVLAKFPGPTFSINTFFTERVNETLSGYNGAVVVNLFGSDLNTLDQKAGEIAAALQKIRGATSVQVQSPPGMPQVVVQLRRNAITRWGFDPVQVLDALQTAYGGDTVGQIYQGNRVFDVSVILAPRDRQDVAAIGSLPLRSPDGNYVLLRQLADIHESSGRYIVLHDGARRVQTITCNVAGRNVNSFVAEAKSRIARISLPPGTYVEFGGTAAEQARSLRELLVHSLLAGLGIVLLLSVVMGNYRNLLLVLLNLPFALVGGVLAILLMGGEVSLGSMIGFVTLFGITLRNSIMMISHYENLVAEEGMTWGWPAALRGASERLAPILMTALVTGLALLPLALGSGDPGREIEGPMAIVILGGLATSTLLNLLVLPTLALRFGRFEPHREEL
ncbi:MAG TPA: efflux RND transporter permease subunit [Candidatus Limnocylindrales bacterium]|nr:efflux RND transporter permease subunit [Candidatus Limnocylindrales bacterium]